MSYFVKITYFPVYKFNFRTCSLEDPDFDVRYMYHNSNSSYSDIHRLSVAFLSFYGVRGGGGKWVFSLFLLLFSCDHYFHIDFQNKKRKQLNLVLVL